jgi:16S rRNA (adenine1518-N6/adenine1519-N6)-dimethyltransferase
MSGTGSGPVSDGVAAEITALPPLRDVIRTHGLAADKRLGQNFILDLNLTRRIARAASPHGDKLQRSALAGLPLAGRSVIEIGPGPGGLTRALLLEGADHVLAVERDRRCLPALTELADASGGRLTIVEGDALAVDWPALVRDLPSKPVIAANLPYNIATQLLIGWLETTPWPPWFSGMTLMFQKEVAERIVAEPDSKAYGRLAVISQWRSEPRLLFTLPPEAFTPPPKISSAIVTFAPRAEPMPVCNVHLLGRVTAAAFGQRRKMLRQSLKALVPDPEVLLSATGIDGTRRGETLTVSDFARMAAVMEKLAGRT